MERLLGAAEAARALELAPSARHRLALPEASQRTRRTAPALDGSADDAQAPTGTRPAAILLERRGEMASIAAYPTFDAEKHAVGQSECWNRQHSPGLGIAALQRSGCATPLPVHHKSGQGRPCGQATMFCARKVPSRKPTTIPRQPFHRKESRASERRHGQNSSEFPILSLRAGILSASLLALGTVGCSSTAADSRQFDLAKWAVFGPRRKFDEPPSSSKRTPSQPSLREQQQKCALRCVQLRSAARPSSVAIAASSTRRAKSNSSRQKERIKMTLASRGLLHQTTLARVCREATIPYYSTKQVRRVADKVLGKNVSGDEASAALLALILDPCDPRILSSDPAEFGRGRSACGYPMEDALSLANSANGSALCDMRRLLRRHAAHSTRMRQTPGSDNPAIFKNASKEPSGMRDLPAKPSRGCRGRGPNLERSLQAKRAPMNIIPIVESGSANSVNSRTGSPKCAAAYRGHALHRAAVRSLLHGGITLPFRKRRHERRTWNGYPHLVQRNERKSRDN